MSKNTSQSTLPDLKRRQGKKPVSGRASGDASSSHSHYYLRKDMEFVRVSKEYYRKPDTEFSSETYHCCHPPGRAAPPPPPPPLPAAGWDPGCGPSSASRGALGDKLVFLASGAGVGQTPRVRSLLAEWTDATEDGFMLSELDHACVVMDYLVDRAGTAWCDQGLTRLLRNVARPIHMRAASEIAAYFGSLQHYIGFIGYLLAFLRDEDHWRLAAEALVGHLEPQGRLGGCVRRRHVLCACAAIVPLVVGMLHVSLPERFSTFLNIALQLACDSSANCISMIKEGLLDHILYRFNPYFPRRDWAFDHVAPADSKDFNVKLGESAKNMSTTLSLLLVLMRALKELVDSDTTARRYMPCPDAYAQRCFISAFRYECCARDHRLERAALTAFAVVMVHCFGERLTEFSSGFTADVMSLSVLDEVPPSGWTRRVRTGVGVQDAQFKRLLLQLSCALLRVYPANVFMVESQFWAIGLMYLLDPLLFSIRTKWPPPLYGEIRKVSLQSLVMVLPRLDGKLILNYGITRRILWYVEWYAQCPYEITTLYWCLRVLGATLHQRGSAARVDGIQGILQTHGIVILMNLCKTMAAKERYPTERTQAVLGLALRIVAGALECGREIRCALYPRLRWPDAAGGLAATLLDHALAALDDHRLVSDRWLIPLLNFIWEGVIWKPKNRETFLADNGVYKLLDLITAVGPNSQCMALAIVCDIARAGEAIEQLITWRAWHIASASSVKLVKRGATVAALLAAVTRDECREREVELTDTYMILDRENPLVSDRDLESMRQPIDPLEQTEHLYCFAAADLGGSRMAKAYGILQMLTEDLEAKVSLLDDAYKLYKNIELSLKDEVALVICSHYLTLKMNEAWLETEHQYPGMVPPDDDILREFQQLNLGWAKAIRQQQEEVRIKHNTKEERKESSLYEYLRRIRLTTSLEALAAIRGAARATDAECRAACMLQEAIEAHYRRKAYETTNDTAVIRTFRPPLDLAHKIGQNIKVPHIRKEISSNPITLMSSRTVEHDPSCDWMKKLKCSLCPKAKNANPIH